MISTAWNPDRYGTFLNALADGIYITDTDRKLWRNRYNKKILLCARRSSFTLSPEKRQYHTFTRNSPTIGLLTNAELPEQRVWLKSNDKILLYTDGVIEARNRADQEFGDDGLLDHLGQVKAEFSPTILQELNENIMHFFAKQHIER